MKNQRDKPKNKRSSDKPGKSLYQLYNELLYLRKEVKEAEQRSTAGARKPPKPDR